MAENGDARRDFESRVCTARCALQERGVRGRDPEDVLSMLAMLLDDRGIDVRKVIGPDAVRVEITDRASGEKVRYDREGRDPLKRLMESDLLISTRRLDPSLDGDVTVRGCGEPTGYSGEERMEMLREGMSRFGSRTELRTKGFMELLEDMGENANLGFSVRYGVPEYCEGLTPYSRRQSCFLRITDSVSGDVLWEGRSDVHAEGLDTARMLAFRQVFASAGLLENRVADWMAEVQRSISAIS